MIKSVKKILRIGIVLIFLVVLMAIVYASSVNYLTKGRADNLYMALLTCADNEILKYDTGTSSWACDTDVQGGGGGAGLWQVDADGYMRGNASAGGTQSIDVDMVNTSRINVSEDIFLHGDIYLDFDNKWYLDYPQNNNYLYFNQSEGVLEWVSTLEQIFTGSGMVIKEPTIVRSTATSGFLVEKADLTDIFRIDTTNDWVYAGNIRPRSDNTYNIGQPGARFNNLWLSGKINASEINVTRYCNASNCYTIADFLLDNTGTDVDDDWVNITGDNMTGDLTTTGITIGDGTADILHLNYKGLYSIGAWDYISNIQAFNLTAGQIIVNSILYLIDAGTYIQYNSLGGFMELADDFRIALTTPNMLVTASNSTFTGNTTVRGYECHNDNCSSYTYHNGTALIIQS